MSFKNYQQINLINNHVASALTVFLPILNCGNELLFCTGFNFEDK